MIYLECNCCMANSADKTFYTVRSGMYIWVCHGKLVIKTAHSNMGELCVCSILLHFVSTGLGGSVGCISDWWSEGRRFDFHQVQQYSSEEIAYEIFSVIFLCLLLIQEGICQFLVKECEQELNLSSKNGIRITDLLDMTLIVLTGP